MAQVAIYGLVDSGNRLRYIGKANDPAKRLKSHMRDSRRRNTPLYAWLRKHGEPRMMVLETCDASIWPERERLWIKVVRESCDLLNLADGGDQPKTCPKQNSANGTNTIHGPYRGYIEATRKIGVLISAHKGNPPTHLTEVMDYLRDMPKALRLCFSKRWIERHG